MDSQIQMTIVLIIVMSASFITWKIIKDFYKPKFNMVFTHLIAVATASFMFLSSMSLFIPKNYQRGATAEVELNLTSVLIVFAMIGMIYFIFKYLPNRNR